MNATVKTTGRFLTLHESGNGLTIRLTPEGRQELAENMESHPEWSDVDHFAELFEDFRANGEWEFVDPGELGGLTGCQLAISPDLERDNHGQVIECDTVYWHERYAIELAHESLLAGELWLRKA